MSALRVLLQPNRCGVPLFAKYSITPPTSSINRTKTTVLHPTTMHPYKTFLLGYYCCYVNFFTSSTSSGLPFTRGTKDHGEEQQHQQQQGTTQSTQEAVIAKHGHVISVSSSDPTKNHHPHRNSVVEHFFDENDDSSSSSSQSLLREVKRLVTDQSDFLISTRRALHQIPELMYNEKDTSDHIQTILRRLDVPHTTGWAINTNGDVYPGPGGYGVVADIGTGKPPCVLLRADMDALPITERTESIDDFISRRDSKMHACGHVSQTFYVQRHHYPFYWKMLVSRCSLSYPLVVWGQDGHTT